MQVSEGPVKLLEIVRVLQRKLGMLDDMQVSCCGVTFAQCQALVEIGRAGTASLNDLADALAVDKSTMSRTIDNLVGGGLAVREPDADDRRYLRIALTGSGQRTYHAVEQGLRSFLEQVYARIPEPKRAQVVESLELLLKAFAESECCQVQEGEKNEL